MAKKKEATSPFVPVEKQPYAVPENWRWVRLGVLYQVNPKNNADGDTEAAFIPMEKIEPGMISTFSFEVQPWSKAKKGHTQFADGDVAFAKISPCFENRKSMMVNGLPNGIGGGTTELIILRNPDVLQAFTFWLVSTDAFIRGGMNTYSGTVGQQRISMDYVKQYPVPLPPLPEQQRIVDRIESLFAKLDEAKEKAQAALDSFEIRKAAMLHKAFSGELTAEWRNINNISFDYAVKPFESCIEKMQNGLAKRTGTGENTAVLRLANLLDDGFDTDDLRMIPLDKKEVLTYGLSKNDVLMIRVNGSKENVGKQLLFDRDDAWAYCDHIIRIKYTNAVIPRFAVYYSKTRSYRQYILDHMVSSAGQNTISRKGMAGLSIPIPAIPEQTEIVRILDDFFAKESRAKEQIEATLAAIDTMKKAILAKAFRGELGTNDPMEEPAELITDGNACQTTEMR